MDNSQTKRTTKSLLMCVAINWILYGVVVSSTMTNMTPSLQLFIWTICTLLASQIVFLFTGSTLQQQCSHVLFLTILISLSSSLGFYLLIERLPAQVMLNVMSVVFTLLAGLFGLLLLFKKNAAPQQTLLIVCLAFWAFSSTPLWLGGLFEISSVNSDKVSLLTSATPLGLLATSIDYQYLTNPWFYRHTPLGMMYYQVFPLSTLMPYYVSATTLCWLTLACWDRPKSVTS